MNMNIHTTYTMRRLQLPSGIPKKRVQPNDQPTERKPWPTNSSTPELKFSRKNGIKIFVSHMYELKACIFSMTIWSLNSYNRLS